MKKSTRLLLDCAWTARIESIVAPYVAGKFSWQRPKIPQRARVLPSSFLAPFFTSSIEKTWKRRKRPSVPLNDSSRGGTDRPRYTDGASSAVPKRPSAPAQRRGAPPSLPCDPGIVSEHIGFDPTPNFGLAGLRSIVVETTRFSNQPKTG